MKTCSKCTLPKELDEFAFKNRERQLRHSHCRECQRAYKRKHYEKDKDGYKAKVKASNAEIKKRNREYVRSVKLQASCKDCGLSDPNVLQFDHLSGKLRSVSEMASSQASLRRLKEEIAKCEIVCANCHSIRTAKRGGWYIEHTRV